MDPLLKESILSSVDSQLEELLEIKRYIYENPETGGEEKLSSARLISYLKGQGFQITEDYCGIPWCFRAVYDSGRPGVTVGLTAEYDALPEIGHACGHNIIAAAPLGAAVSLKESAGRLGGKIVLLGTPAEENLDRKIDLIKAGAFAEMDICLNIHPYGYSMMPLTSTAFDSWKIDFYGKAAHAAIHPEDGINALDTAVNFYQTVNSRKYLIEGLNLNGIISEGGVKYSIIPDHTVVKFAARAYSADKIKAAESLVRDAADEACRMNGAAFSVERDEAANLPLNTSRTLAEIFCSIYGELSGETMEYGEFKASLDLGDVSWRVPTIMACVGIGCPDTDLHTPEFREATMTPAGDRAVDLAAKALALTALRVMEDKGLLQAVRREFVRSLVR